MKPDCDRIVQETQALLKLNHDVNLQDATAQELHDSLGQAVMMAIHENWSRSKEKRATSRRAFYFSAEYLVGRMVYSNLYNLGILQPLRQAFQDKGIDLACLEEIEDDALGNGGLGRLAACFLDSAATMNLPLSGYGLRYRFGLFKQRFDENGSQRELADDWDEVRRPLELPARPAHRPGGICGPDRSGRPVRHARHRLRYRLRRHRSGSGSARPSRSWTLTPSTPQDYIKRAAHGQKPGRGHHPRPLPERQHRRGQAAAHQAAVLSSRQRVAAEHPAHLQGVPRATADLQRLRRVHAPSSSTTRTRPCPSRS